MRSASPPGGAHLYREGSSSRATGKACRCYGVARGRMWAGGHHGPGGHGAGGETVAEAARREAARQAGLTALADLRPRAMVNAGDAPVEGVDAVSPTFSLGRDASGPREGVPESSEPARLGRFRRPTNRCPCPAPSTPRASFSGGRATTSGARG